MHGNDVIDMGKVLSRNGITGEDSLALQLPRFNDGVEVVIAHRAMAFVTQTDGIQRRGIDLITRYGDIILITVRRTGEHIEIALLAVMVILRARIDTADNIYTLRDKEGIITHLVLLAIGIMIGIIDTLLDEDLENTVAIKRRVRLTRRNDIIERIAETMERIQDTRTHLAIHIRGIVRSGIILQGTRRLGVDEVGMHDVQTIHHIFRINIDGEVLINRPGADLDEVVILCYQGIRTPRIVTRRTIGIPFGTGDTGYIHGVKGGKDTHRLTPLIISHTRAGKRRGHLNRVIEDIVEGVLSIPTDTLGLLRREFHVTLPFQTAGFNGAEGERIVRLLAGAREDTGDIGIVVCLIMPQGGRVHTGVGVIKPHTSGGRASRVLAYRRGEHTRQSILTEGCRCLDIDTTTGLRRIMLDNRTADERIRLEVETAAVCLRGILLNDAVTDMGIVGHYSCSTDTILQIRGVGMTVHDEQTIHHSAVFLRLHERQLIADRLIPILIIGLLRRKEVVRKGHDMEGISFRTGRRCDLTGEDGTIGQRVTLVFYRGAGCSCLDFITRCILIMEEIR